MSFTSTGEGMVDKILCPNCHKINGIHKFCIYCGAELMDEDQMSLFLDNPEPYCLNCGRDVKKNQTKCECGYEFVDIKCPECNAENSYSNRFCTSCGKKLWESNINLYRYKSHLFEHHILKVILPSLLHNTSLYKRFKKGVGRDPEFSMDCYVKTMDDLNNLSREIEGNLSEISSRWKIVSPNYCLNCFSIINPIEFKCSKCESYFSPDKERIITFQSENNYSKPQFENEDLKWTSKNTVAYKGSLAPALGESQFEYRERLKWEFAENMNILKNVIPKIRREKEIKKEIEEYVRKRKERKRRKMELIRKYGGGCCGYSCRYCCEEYYNSSGGVVGDIDGDGYTEYYCQLGYPVELGSYCRFYE